jgi:hypothetical protein
MYIITCGYVMEKKVIIIGVSWYEEKQLIPNYLTL